MVFILLGAVQGAKAAKLEYEKKKKRNAMITSVEGSSDMLANRNGGTGANGEAGIDTWYGGLLRHQPQKEERQVVDEEMAGPSQNTVGAWSRDVTSQNLDVTVAPLALGEGNSEDSRATSGNEYESRGVGGVSERYVSVDSSPVVEEEEVRMEVRAEGESRKEVRERKVTRKAPPIGSFVEASKAEREGKGEKRGVEDDVGKKNNRAADGSFSASMRNGASELKRKDTSKERALAAMARKKNSLVHGVGEKERKSGEEGMGKRGNVGKRRGADGSYATSLGADARRKAGSGEGTGMESFEVLLPVEARGGRRKKETVGSVRKDVPDGSFAAVMWKDAAKKVGTAKEEVRGEGGYAMANVVEMTMKKKSVLQVAEVEEKRSGEERMRKRGNEGKRRGADGSYATALGTDGGRKAVSGEGAGKESFEALLPVGARGDRRKNKTGGSVRKDVPDGSFAAVMWKDAAKKVGTSKEEVRIEGGSAMANVVASAVRMQKAAKSGTKGTSEIHTNIDRESSSMTAGSSMYAAGTLKKRVSRRH